MIPAPEGKIQVFLVAMRRTSIDSLFHAFKLAKIKPTALVIKPLALARLVKEPGVILIDVQPSEFDIVVLVDGVPQPTRTVPFPATSLTWQEKAPIIIDEVDRTLKFCADNNPDKPLATDLPLYVSGELIDQPELCQKITERFGFKALLLDSPLTHPAGFAPHYYLVNTGLTVIERPAGLDTVPPVTSLNLLPVEYRIKPVNWGRVLAVPVTTLFIGMVIPLTMLIIGASDNIASARDQLDVTSQMLQEKQAQKQEMRKEIRTLEESLVQLQVSRDAGRNLLEALVQRADSINGDLQTAVDDLPEMVRLTKINRDSEALTLNGECIDEGVILLYARELDNSGRFSQPIVSKIHLEESRQHSFILTFKK
jgi:Tfp pilus assembly protein PilN